MRADQEEDMVRSGRQGGRSQFCVDPAQNSALLQETGCRQTDSPGLSIVGKQFKGGVCERVERAEQ